MLLNHTSLFEPIFLAVLPWPLLWEMASRATFPVADKTYDRPIAGRFFRFFAPGVVRITRKRDDSWQEFLTGFDPKSLVMITPEGRMKRPNGLDLRGKPMTVLGGIVDVLSVVESGKMIIAYSGGLHHIQSPGQRLPHFFRKASIRLEALDIESYLQKFVKLQNEKEFRNQIISDLQIRRDQNCPVLSR